MANSLTAKIKKLHHDGKISDKEYKSLLRKLEGHDLEIKKQTVDQILSEITKLLIEKRNVYDKMQKAHGTSWPADGFPNSEVEKIIDSAKKQAKAFLEDLASDDSSNLCRFIPITSPMGYGCNKCGLFSDVELDFDYCPGCGRKIIKV